MKNFYEAPCKDCMDRKIGCHSNCEKYLEFKRYREAINKNNKIKNIFSAPSYTLLERQKRRKHL